MRTGCVAAFLALAGFGSAHGIGLYVEPAPWYDAAYVDTTLAFVTGVTAFTGDGRATLFDLGMNPIRRGPVRLAITWNYVFQRSTAIQTWGVGDPKIHARVSLPLLRRIRTGFFLEAAARLPVAQAELFPYAFGGQDIAVMAVFDLGHGALTFAAGRQFTEPPSDSDLRSEDVPHATQLWLQVSHPLGALTGQLRVDGLLFDLESHRRMVVEARLVHAPTSKRLSLRFAAKAEIGPDRIFDFGAQIGFIALVK